MEAAELQKALKQPNIDKTIAKNHFHNNYKLS
jgi:hypothetical protein